jgi:hypothetical protein
MWLHLPEISVNLAQCLRVIPQQDGKLQIVQPDNITVTVDGVNAAAVCGLLATLPGGHLDSWLGKRINLNQPAQPAPAAGAGAASGGGGGAASTAAPAAKIEKKSEK